MLIIGSRALAHHFPSLNISWKDIDLIATRSNLDYLLKALKPKKVVDRNELVSLIDIKPFGFYDTKNVEILISDQSVALTSYLNFVGSGTGLRFAPIEVLYSLKKSHIHFPIKFNKHIKDYCILHDFLKGEDKLSDITKIHFKEIETRLGKLKTPSLNKSVKNFFDQSNGYVKSFFIHDDIHQVMSHYDRPLYEKMQRDLSLAKCEKELWNQMSFEEKSKCVLEEAYVIALERKVLPMLFGAGQRFTSQEAFDWAMMRICTTLCSGWFRQFATDNFFKIQEYYNPKYVEKFLINYQNGNIKRNNQSKTN